MPGAAAHRRLVVIQLPIITSHYSVIYHHYLKAACNSKLVFTFAHVSGGCARRQGVVLKAAAH